MSVEPEPELRRVAEAIGDGRSVDWVAETATLPEIRTLLAELRLIEAVAAAAAT